MKKFFFFASVLALVVALVPVLLLRKSSSPYNLALPSSNIKVSLAAASNTAVVAVEKGQTKVNFETALQGVTLEKENDKFVYKDDKGAMEIRYHTIPKGFKEEIILNQPVQQVEFKVKVSLKDAVIGKNLDGQPVIFDKNGNYQFHFQKPFAQDGKGEKTYNLSYTWTNLADLGNLLLTLVVDQNWLSDPKRVYPIIIDPTIIDDEKEAQLEKEASKFAIATVSSDPVNYYDPSSDSFKTINETIVPSDDPLYNYMVKEGIDQVYFKANPSTSQTIKLYYDSLRASSDLLEKSPQKTGYTTFQPMSLNFRNDLGQIQQISTVQSATGAASANTFSYPNIFGNGLNLNYTYTSTSLKEELVVNAFSNLPQPGQYILDGKNATLDLDEVIDWADNLDIYIDGKLWDKKTTMTTTGQVEFKNGDTVLFFIPPAYARDSSESKNEILLTQQFKKQGTKFYVIKKTPYSWLADPQRVYPIKIDPSYTVKTVVGFDSTAYNSQRKLARKSNGELWTVYPRSDGTRNQIYAAYSTNGGQTWTEEQVSYATGTYNQQYPSIAIDSSDNVHVVWDGQGWGTNTSYNNIQYRKRTTSWQAQEAVTDKNNYQVYPSIAIDSSDNVHVVWQGYGWGTNTGYVNIQYRKRTTSWQTQEAVTDKNNYQVYPSIAIDSSDNVHVVWQGYGWGTNTSYWNIQYRKRTTSWQTQEVVTDTNYHQYYPSIAIDSSDNVHVVWDGQGWGTNTSYNNIQYRKRTTSWQTQEAVTDKNNYQQYPSIAIDSSDNVHVVWQGYGWGTNTDYYNIQYRKRTTSWQTQEGLTDSATNQKYPNLIWALRPTVSGVKTNRPKTGYAFVWQNGTALTYYASSDLTWESPPPPGTRFSGVKMQGICVGSAPCLTRVQQYVAGPNSPGTVVDDATVGTVAWTNPSNAMVSDNTYAYANGNVNFTTHYLKASNFGFNIPIGATIDGIVVEIEKWKGAADFGAIDAAVKIVKGGSVGSTNKADTVTRWPSTEAYVSHGGPSDLWGEAWTASNINASDFGVVVSTTHDGNPVNSVGAYVDHIRITVYYTN